MADELNIKNLEHDVRALANQFALPTAEVQFILWSEIHQLERGVRIRDFVRVLAVKHVKDSLSSRVRRPVNAAMTTLHGSWRDSRLFG